MSKKSRTPVNPAQIATRLADQTSLWQALVHYDATSRYYTRLAGEPGYEAWLLTWLPGQGTDWHDHGDSAGAFVVLAGSLREHGATLTADGPRLRGRPVEFGPGSLRPFGSRHIHHITNAQASPVVSLHVYSPALTRMNTYRLTGDRLRLEAAELAGVNW